MRGRTDYTFDVVSRRTLAVLKELVETVKRNLGLGRSDMNLAIGIQICSVTQFFVFACRRPGNCSIETRWESFERIDQDGSNEPPTERIGRRLGSTMQDCS